MAFGLPFFTHGHVERKFLIILLTKKPSGKTGRRQKDNIKKNLGEVAGKGSGWNCLSIIPRGRDLVGTA